MSETQVKTNQASWEPAAAFACFVGSVLSLALGFAFTTDWVLNAVRHPVLHAVGITLLIIGIPILILGGHCLDLMDKKKQEVRSGSSSGTGRSARIIPKRSNAGMRPLKPNELRTRQIKSGGASLK